MDPQTQQDAQAAPAILTPQNIAIIRVLAMLIGGFAVGRGWMSQESLDTLTEPGTFITLCLGAAALGSAGWAIYSRRAHGMIQDTNKLKQVDAIIVKPKTAAEIQTSGVVGSVDDAAKVVPARAHKAASAHVPHAVTH